MGTANSPDDGDLELKFEDSVDKPDPATILASAYMKRAEADVDDQATATRPSPPPTWRFVSGVFTFPWYPSTLHVWLWSTLGLMLALLLVTFCYHMLNIMFVLGRILGLPVGILTAAVMSYVSAMYLCVVRDTAEGCDAIEDWSDESWRERFWTLPSTLGMLIIALGAGWFIGRLAGDIWWLPALLIALLLYPVLQLCSLDADSVIMPVSARILRTLSTHASEWAIFYVETSALIFGFCTLAYAVFADPPYVSVIILTPFLSTLILVYGRLLGRLASTFGPEEGQR